MRPLRPDPNDPPQMTWLFITLSNSRLRPEYGMGSLCCVSQSIDQNCEIIRLHASSCWNQKYPWTKAGDMSTEQTHLQQRRPFKKKICCCCSWFSSCKRYVKEGNSYWSCTNSRTSVTGWHWPGRDRSDTIPSNWRMLVKPQTANRCQEENWL